LGGGTVYWLEAARRHLDQGCEQLLPDAALRPAMKGYRLWSTACTPGRILPPAAGLQNVDDATKHATIIDPPSTWLIGRQQGLDRYPLFIAE